MKGTLEERFWAKVDKKGQDECWEWTASKGAHGYGQIGEGSRMLLAHRVSWGLQNGSIPAGMCVLHRYDNPACVNPSHLRLGLQADNVRDMMNRGRSARGERQGSSKLTAQDVYEIGQMLGRGIPERVIAKKYGVTQSNISQIKTGETWGWLK